MRERVAPLPFFVGGAVACRALREALSAEHLRRHDLRRQLLPVNPTRERMFNVPAVVLALVAVLGIVHVLPGVCVHAGGHERIHPHVCVHPGPLQRGPAVRRTTSGRIRRRHLDLHHLRLHPRRLQSPGIQLHLAPRLRQRAGAALRCRTLPGIFRADRRRRGGRSPHRSFWRAFAGDRRLGRDFGRDGRRHPICVPERRADQGISHRR